MIPLQGGQISEGPAGAKIGPSGHGAGPVNVFVAEHVYLTVFLVFFWSTKNTTPQYQCPWDSVGVQDCLDAGNHKQMGLHCDVLRLQAGVLQPLLLHFMPHQQFVFCSEGLPLSECLQRYWLWFWGCCGTEVPTLGGAWMTCLLGS